MFNIIIFLAGAAAGYFAPIIQEHWQAEKLHKKYRERLAKRIANDGDESTLTNFQKER